MILGGEGWVLRLWEARIGFGDCCVEGMRIEEGVGLTVEARAFGGG